MVALLTAVATIAALGAVSGLILGLAARKLPPTGNELEDQVDSLLPQTQCGQCGYPGCRPYARAIVSDEAAINLCPPGGESTVSALADLLGRDPLPLADAQPAQRSVAIIDETLCIGCTHCRAACPVDAIFGAQQAMHTVIESECTGCELCILPCPVDCIAMRPVI